MLVVDASTALAACAAPNGWDLFATDPDLVAPPLMWSEARSVLHEAARNGELSAAEARRLRRGLERAPVSEQGHPALGDATWDLAERLGLARTYGAEYLALARLLGCPLVTLDARLRARARGRAQVLGPAEFAVRFA